MGVFLAQLHEAHKERMRRLFAPVRQQVPASPPVAVAASVPPLLSVRSITRFVADAQKLRPEYLLSDSREHKVAHARYIAFYLIRRLMPKVTRSAIAKHFDKDHTTVLYGLRYVESHIAADPDFAARLAQLEADLRIRTRPLKSYLSRSLG